MFGREVSGRRRLSGIVNQLDPTQLSSSAAPSVVPQKRSILSTYLVEIFHNLKSRELEPHPGVNNVLFLFVSPEGVGGDLVFVLV